jgi:hypothetical protein
MALNGALTAFVDELGVEQGLPPTYNQRRPSTAVADTGAHVPSPSVRRPPAAVPERRSPMQQS